MPLSQTQGAAFYLPSEDSNLLLQDVNYFTEVGTAPWGGLNMANSALDRFEKIFGTYEYPQ